MQSALLFIVSGLALLFGVALFSTKEDGCPYGWEEADWNNSPGVKMGYWFCRKQ
jgi:hypothetical protein